MNELHLLLDGSDNGKLKVRVFAFLQRLDATRQTNAEVLAESVSRVFRNADADGLVQDWVSMR